MPKDAEGRPLPRLRVAGVGLRGSGYPNAINTLRHLQHAGVGIEDQVDWLPEGLHLWKVMRGPLKGKLALYARLLLGNAWAAWRVCRATGRERLITYLPYPSIFLLWWMSWLPKHWRPPLVADAYISVWDSAVRDRALVGRGRWSDRLLRIFEARALRTADAVLVDTVANRDWMIGQFGLASGSVFAIPLAIDDQQLLELAAAVPERPLRVSFIGTLVPLHGIDVLMDSVRRTADPDRVLFHLVGDGQDAMKVEEAAASGLLGFAWERGWQSHEQIIEHIERSDVCLGVFGGAAKASRVLPFKLYLALAAGRAIVTQREFSLPQGVPAPPFLTLDPDSAKIASLLRALADDPAMCVSIAQAGRDFYLEWLGERALLRAWRRIFAKMAVR